MKLQEELIQKLNTALHIVCEHHNLLSIIDKYNELHNFSISSFIEIKQIRSVKRFYSTEYACIEDYVELLKVHCPDLVPFYMIYFEDDFYSHSDYNRVKISKETFLEINEIVKKIKSINKNIKILQ